MNMMAIDPGNKFSAYVVMDMETYKPIMFEKIPNDDLIEKIRHITVSFVVAVFVIERVENFGMAVGREVFDTCEWIGRFSQEIMHTCGTYPDYVFRNEEKQVICHSNKAKDTNIRRALIDRFAKHDLKNGKGTQSNRDFFYGFAKDVWAAFAVGYTWLRIKGYVKEE